jgi:hypothetical protein
MAGSPANGAFGAVTRTRLSGIRPDIRNKEDRDRVERRIARVY